VVVRVSAIKPLVKPGHRRGTVSYIFNAHETQEFDFTILGNSNFKALAGEH
jgi:hypothetical protein